MYNNMEVDIGRPLSELRSHYRITLTAEVQKGSGKRRGQMGVRGGRPTGYPEERLRKDERVVGRAERACLHTWPPTACLRGRTRPRRALTDRNGIDTVTTTGLPARNSHSAGTTYSAILSRMATRVDRRNRTPCDKFHSLNGTSINKPTFILAAT